MELHDPAAASNTTCLLLLRHPLLPQVFGGLDNPSTKLCAPAWQSSMIFTACMPPCTASGVE
jgi:hypothetical protein